LQKSSKKAAKKQQKTAPIHSAVYVGVEAVKFLLKRRFFSSFYY
jgi:hypothetical protein